ncbi:MAG: beta-galactosidase [Clostridia bacterium]|nr:beta-galactosidase [Clostridia bacterium]
MEFIRVAKDHWNFETESGERFYPFGANMNYRIPVREKDENGKYHDVPGKFQESLHVIASDEWDPKRIKSVFKGAKKCNMNVLKVFIACPLVAADPQVPGKFKLREMTPSFPDRLKELMDIAEETGVYVSLTLTEWCMNGSKWFHEGGTFFGCEEPGKLDSFYIYQQVWKIIAKVCKGRPGLFAYNLATELYLPAGNWGVAEGSSFWKFQDQYGLEPYRRWLRFRYKTIDELNRSWGTSFGDYDEINQPEIKWYRGLGRYSESIQEISDFNDFKECVSYFFLKNQTDAIRSIDKKHMITIGLHPDQGGISTEGFAWKHCGIGSGELDNFDFVTLHVYTEFDYLLYRPELPKDFHAAHQSNEEDITRRLRECLLYARFNNFGKPCLVEEFGHVVPDWEETADVVERTVKFLAGHVSGFQLWFLGNSPDQKTPGVLDYNDKPNEYGKRFAALKKYLDEFPPERIPAKTVCKIPRVFGNAPDKRTVPEKILYNWDAYEHPVDFEFPRNETLAEMKRLGMKRMF